MGVDVQPRRGEARAAGDRLGEGGLPVRRRRRIASKSTPPTRRRCGRGGFTSKTRCARPAGRSSRAGRRAASRRGACRSRRRRGGRITPCPTCRPSSSATTRSAPSRTPAPTACSSTATSCSTRRARGSRSSNTPTPRKHLKTLREATERAAAYGIRLYFVAVSPKLPADHPLFKRLPRRPRRADRLARPAPLHCLCSSQPRRARLPRRRLGPAVQGSPGARRVDLHHRRRVVLPLLHARRGRAGRRDELPAAARARTPRSVIANFMKVTADAVTAQQPQAKVMAWPYSASYVLVEGAAPARAHRPAAAERRAAERDRQGADRHARAASTKHIWDYSVDFDGHSDRIVAQALRCEQRGRELFVKTETSHGIELLHLPYVPAIGRSARQWQSVRALRPAGVLQRWGFIGMFDSAAERVGYQARWDPDFTPGAAALAVARQLVGDAAGHAARRARGATSTTPSTTSRCSRPAATTSGPAFLGPCHPLPVWEPEARCRTRSRATCTTSPKTEASLSTARIDRDATTSRSPTTSARSAAHRRADPGRVRNARDAAARGHEVLQALKSGRAAAGTCARNSPSSRRSANTSTARSARR